MKVLYLHPVAAASGASRSLIELIGALGERVQAVVACPAGPAAEEFRASGIEVVEAGALSQWDNTRYGHYRGTRWLVLVRELLLLPGTLLRLKRLCRRVGPDLLHLNEITLLPAGALLRRWCGRPMVVHVRSLQRGDADSLRTRWTQRLLRRHADAIVAIDASVRRTLPADLAVEIVHNPCRVTAASDAPKARDERLRVAFVGNLLRLKGVYEFVEAARLCRERGQDVEFWVVGANIRAVGGVAGWLYRALDLARDVRGELEAYVARHGLGDRVRFLGYVGDVGRVYRDIDVLCFPSYLDAPGRPVLEAALYKVPSIVATTDPTPDTFVPGVTGIAIAARSASAIADAIGVLAARPGERLRMGANAERLAAENTSPSRCATRMLDVYDRAARRPTR